MIDELVRLKERVRGLQSAGFTHARTIVRLREQLIQKDREIERLRKALNRIASWEEGDTVRGNFDEPNAARIARAALEEGG